MKKKIIKIKEFFLYIFVKKILFHITYKKIPKKQFGRCVTCSANTICHKVNVCKCTDEEQYDVRINVIN